MSTARDNAPFRSLQEQPWSLWWLQGRRLARIEVRRNLFSRRAWWIYFLAFIPTVIILMHLLARSHPATELDDDTYVRPERIASLGEIDYGGFSIRQQFFHGGEFLYEKDTVLGAFYVLSRRAMERAPRQANGRSAPAHPC